jgi:hypothetical protein
MTPSQEALDPLDAAERADHMARRKAVYLRLHPETKHGAAGNGRKKSRQVGDSTELPADRFTAEAAAATGTSERKVQQDVARGEAIPAIAELAGTSLDKGVELDALALAGAREVAA